MNNHEIVKYAVQALEHKGAERAQCIGSFSTTWEITALSGKIELLRTLNDRTSLDLKGYFGGRMGGASISSCGKNSIDEAVSSCLENSKGAREDLTPSMNDKAEVRVFGEKKLGADLEKMIERTNEFLDDTERLYPNVLIRQLILKYTVSERVYVNTFGVDLTEYEDAYSFSIMFSGFDGQDNSSFNNYHMTFKDLNTPIMELGLIAYRLAEAGNMVHTVKKKEKVVGTMLVPPHCLNDFLSQIMRAYASPNALIGGGSKWQSAIGSKVASDSLTLMSRPLSPSMAANEYFTDDGFVTDDQVIIENGVLKSMLADHYTSAKTGLERRKSCGGFYVIPKGTKTLSEIMASIENGILINRFSGGNAGASGELSGIAKNSFYIKNGRLDGAARETMISANLSDMLMNIEAISLETVCDGGSKLPYIAFKNVTIL